MGRRRWKSGGFERIHDAQDIDVISAVLRTEGVHLIRTISGEAAGSLGDVAGLVSAALQRRAPATCLWIGATGAFEDALEPHLREGGKACAIFTAASSADGSVLAQGNYCLGGSPLSTNEFPQLVDVLAFAQTRPDPPVVTRAFAAALRDARNRPGRPALDVIAEDFQLRTFDLVVMTGEQMLTGSIVRRTHGSAAILFDGVKTTFGGAAAFATLFADVRYKLVAANDQEFGGWALFVLRDAQHAKLPVHFFTIVLNGEPFIRYHEQMLRDLDCAWHWHIVEGVASLVKDTAWSVASGGHISPDLHNRGKSNDGTTEYLDELKARYPNRISIYRKPPDVFWDGKLEMVSAPIPAINEPCLLWQVDADELWRADQVEAVRRMFIEEPERGAAYFWCNYYVGPDKAISTRYNYAQNPNQEWLRVWRFEPGMIWDKHEPPVLVGFDAEGQRYDVGKKNPFMHLETEEQGAVFDHFAYSTAQQAQFKESYYGYADAVKQWRALQAHAWGSGHLKDYFAWVSDDTMFDTAERLTLVPLGTVDPETGAWRFQDLAGYRQDEALRKASRPKTIVVDGVFFQLAGGGISRLWINLLKEWVRSGFGEQVIVLDRGGTIDRIDGVVYHSIDRHSWDTIDGDAAYLQAVCDRLGADLFLSTYYTTPIRTPSVFMGYDMIPEAMGFDLEDLWWRQKRRAIQYAVGHTMISQSSAREMSRIHPDLPMDDTLVAYCSVDPHFRACPDDEVMAFRKKFGIEREFVMLVGERFGWKGYKNGAVVFSALALMPPEVRPLLVCVGGQPQLEDSARALLGDDDVRLLRLDDGDLRTCYAAALAYICPSSMEGFGLPIAEAMTVGCPALVCANSSIPEVAGEAGIYFDPNDPGSLVDAIDHVRDPAQRAACLIAGRTQVEKFDQMRSAKQIADFCLDTMERVASGKLRVHSQALADSLKEAECRRAAEQQAAVLDRAVMDLKTSLSAVSRIPATERDAEIETMARAMATAERDLASAYASALPGLVAQPPHASLNSADALESLRDLVMPLALVDARGLQAPEGPYPQFAIARQFRWQVEPTSTFLFRSDNSADAVFELLFGNLEANQSIRVLYEGQVLGSVDVPASGWEHVWQVALPMRITPGPVEISIEARQAAGDHDDGHARHIAVYGISIKAR